jgi:diketogulonate reductase-like aldo/keto reductase
MRVCRLPGGGTVPVLGLGTWRMGEADNRRLLEVTAVRRALELGYRLIDTAEMYGEGGAESVIGAALGQALRAGDLRREDLFVVSKVYPHNASRSGTVQACERSLARLGLERIDLYLLHWRGQHPLVETCAAMQALVEAGRIARWGVSNFDVDDLVALQAAERDVGLSAPEQRCATNQVYYSLRARGVEFELLPWMRERGMPLMAYSPIDQGTLADKPFLREMGARRGVSAAQIALAWVLHQDGVLTVPKALREAHQRENLEAHEVALSAEELAQLDRQFPAPRRKTPLSML